MAGYIGARSGTISATVANVQDVTATDTTPEVTIINNTHEDTDGGREGKVIFKGQQSGGEESTLAEIQGSHDGTSDDEKGDLIFKTNDGSDGASPTERLRIDSNGSIVPSTLGTSNVKFGLNAGNNIASGGNYNTVIGEEAGNDITTGDNNTLIGTFSGDAITTSGGNTAVGSYTMTSMTDGSDNVAVGTSALDVDTKGNNSVAIGRNALGAQNFTSATNAYNVAVGHSAGVSNTTGTYNTFIGPQAGFNITTGSKNTILGQFDGNAHGLDIRTYSNNIVLSDGDGNIGLVIEDVDGYARGRMGANPQTTYNAAALKVERNVSDHVTAIQTYIDSSSNRYAIIFGNSNASNVGNITTNGSATAFNTSSDYRLKENVADITDGITRVKQLAPKRFNFIADADTTVDGFLAHEAATVVPEAVSGEKDAVNDEGNIEPQGIDQSKLVPLLTAALQEAIAKIETLETKVAALEAE